MHQDVVILLRSESSGDAGPDAMELTTRGTLEKTDGGLLLRYEESKLTGMENTRTELLLTPARVVLRRSGGVNTQMVFEQGLPHTSLYELAFGTLTVEIYTEALRVKMGENGGLLDIRYRVALNQADTSRNRLKLCVRTCEQG